MARPEGLTIQTLKKERGALKLSLDVRSVATGKKLSADVSELSVCVKCSEKPQLCHSPGNSKKNADTKMTVIGGKAVEVDLGKSTKKSVLEGVTITSFTTKDMGSEPVESATQSCRPAECQATKRGDNTCNPMTTCNQGDYTCSALCFR